MGWCCDVQCAQWHLARLAGASPPSPRHTTHLMHGPPLPRRCAQHVEQEVEAEGGDVGAGRDSVLQTREGRGRQEEAGGQEGGVTVTGRHIRCVCSSTLRGGGMPAAAGSQGHLRRSDALARLPALWRFCLCSRGLPGSKGTCPLASCTGRPRQTTHQPSAGRQRVGGVNVGGGLGGVGAHKNRCSCPLGRHAPAGSDTTMRPPLQPTIHLGRVHPPTHPAHPPLRRTCPDRTAPLAPCRPLSCSGCLQSCCGRAWSSLQPGRQAGGTCCVRVVGAGGWWVGWAVTGGASKAKCSWRRRHAVGNSERCVNPVLPHFKLPAPRNNCQLPAASAAAAVAAVAAHTDRRGQPEGCWGGLVLTKV